MKNANIVKKLEIEGYQIKYKSWGYYSNIPHVRLDGFDFGIVEYISTGNTQGYNIEFVYNHVLDAIMVAENINELLLQIIRDNPVKGYKYEPYLILSMQDYYNYKKEVFPWDDWGFKWKLLNKEWLYS